MTAKLSQLWSRTALAVTMATLLTLMGAPPVAADAVTPGVSKPWSDGESAVYEFHSSVPPWVQTVMNDVLVNGWADVGTNNSNGPNFVAGATEEVKILGLDIWD